MPATRYDDYESGGSTDYEENVEIIFTNYATIEAEIDSVFGASSQYNQSLGVRWNNVEVIDGCLYADPEKGKYKLFSWKESNDLTPAERLDRGDEPSADDADDFISKTYVNTEKNYELVAARVDEIVDGDGETVVEASSKRRDVEFGEGEGEIELGEWEDLGGDTIDVGGQLISWHGAGENGPSTSTKTLAEAVTFYGEDILDDENDPHGWISDTTGQDILREDLEGRRVRYFVVSREGDKYTYSLSILEDVETGEQIRADNRGGGDSGNSSPSESEAVQEAASLDEGDYPEPLADFLSTAPSLDADEGRANALLDDLVESTNNALTEEMLEDYGGREAIVAEVV